MKKYEATTKIQNYDIDPQIKQKAAELCWDAGEICEPTNGEIHMGSFAVHIYGRDILGVKREYSFIEQTLASPDVVPEGLADLAWKSLGNKIMRKYGRPAKFLGAKDETA